MVWEIGGFTKFVPIITIRPDPATPVAGRLPVLAARFGRFERGGIARAQSLVSVPVAGRLGKGGGQESVEP